MQAKKYGFLVSLVLLVFSTLSLLLVESVAQFWTNIFIGIFASSLVTTVVYLSDYFITKSKTLEDYYLCLLDVIAILSEVVYFDNYQPIDIMRKYWHEEFNSEIYKQMGIEPPTKAYYELLDYYIASSGNLAIAQSRLKYESKALSDKLEKSIDSYLRIRDFSFTDIESAYGNLDFLAGNRKFRAWIYNEIHNYSREKIHYVKEVAFHFDQYRKKEGGSKAVMLDYVTKLQDIFFEHDEDEMWSSRVTPILVYTLSKRAEKLRAKMYKQPEQEVPYPIIFARARLEKQNTGTSDN